MGRLRLVLAFLAAALPLAAEASPGVSCAAEAAQAERIFALPPGLLAAIGVVESGRNDRGHVVAWPYSVNAGGVGFQYATAQEAIGQVRALQAAGVRSIDVGCFQVNLMYHPEAFQSLEEAFDPAANAREAARFLRDLHASSSGWEEAAARYHSSNPPIGQPYGRTVMAVWGVPAAASPAPVTPVKLDILQPALAAAGIHLPAVIINVPGQPRPRPTRLTLAGRFQRG